MNESTTPLLGYSIYSHDLSTIRTNSRLVINTLNGHSYNVAKKDSLFNEALKASDILLPDGDSVVLSVKWLGGAKIRKVAGYDLFMYLMNRLHEENGSCFFLGAMEGTLDKIKNKISNEFPNVRVGSFSPPFKAEFSEEDNELMRKHVSRFSPDVLFVGMTAPKQEKWVHLNKEKLDARIICSIGAVFDFYAGTAKRPPQWMIKLKLEWLGRLLKEPKRLWHRYLVSTPVLLVDVLRYKLKIKN